MSQSCEGCKGHMISTPFPGLFSATLTGGIKMIIIYCQVCFVLRCVQLPQVPSGRSSAPRLPKTGLDLCKAHTVPCGACNSTDCSALSGFFGNSHVGLRLLPVAWDDHQGQQCTEEGTKGLSPCQQHWGLPLPY